MLRKEEAAIYACPLWAKVNPQQRLRALRIALPRDCGGREGPGADARRSRRVDHRRGRARCRTAMLLGPGSLRLSRGAAADRPLPDKDGLAVAKTEVRALALRSDDFRELCEDDPDLAEELMAALADEIGRPREAAAPTPTRA